ncbi:MAG: type II secretion system F family protein [Candidatus Aenigmarchaeota archaeon]|nr:type II secretion system F family protein [Candidatus Aenigmarchaeota archaeon]
MPYSEIAGNIFGEAARKIKPYFLDLKDDLQRAGITYTLEEYLSMAMFIFFITFFFEAILLSFIFALLVGIVMALVLGFMLALGISSFIFFLFYSYPTTMSKSKEKSIKKTLPFAVSYMSVISSSRPNPIVMFKSMGDFKEYGEISKLCSNVARDIEFFGLTVSSALKKWAKRTPSKDLKELLWSMNTILESGGDLTSFLKQKSDDLMADYRRSIRKYSQDLSLYVEIYLTLIITGSIFFIILSAIIATISSDSSTTLIQSFVVFGLLPALSSGFIVIIKSMSPLE